MGGGGMSNGSTGGGLAPWVQGLSTLTGLGISSAGGALGPPLLGLASMIEGSRERGAMRSLAQQFAGEFPGSPGLAKTAFSLADQRLLGPRELGDLRDRAEDAQRRGTWAGTFEERGRGLRQGETIDPQELTGTNVGTFPLRRPPTAAAQEQAGVAETLAQMIRAGVTPSAGLIERATVAPKPETFTSGRFVMERQPGESRFSVVGQAPEEPREHVTGSRVITTAPGQPPRVEEVLTPEEQQQRKRFAEYRAKVDEFTARQERGEKIPLETWRRLITKYGDVIGQNDPIRMSVHEETKALLRATRPPAAPTETTTRKMTPRKLITNKDQLKTLNAAVLTVADDLAAKVPGFKTVGQATVNIPGVGLVPKTKLIERAVRRQLGVEARVVWDGSKFKIVQAWDPSQTLSIEQRRGTARDRAEDEDAESQ